MCVMGASGSVGLGICKEALSVQGLTTYAVSRRRPECLRAMEGDKLIWLDHDIFMLNPRCHSFDFVLNLAFSGCHTKDTPGAFLGNLEQNLGIVKNLLLVSKEASTGLCIHLGSELEALFADPKFLPTSVIESAGNDLARRLYALQKHMQSTVVSEFYALEPSIFSVVLHAPYIVSAFNAPNSLAGMIEYSILNNTCFEPRHPERELRYTTAQYLLDQVIRLARMHCANCLHSSAEPRALMLPVDHVTSVSVAEFVAQHASAFQSSLRDSLGF
jgi:hypothetical protein